MSEHYTSGDWRVGKGKEAEFIERWGEFLQWTRKTQPGLVRASLIEDQQYPGHYVSFAEWQDAAARDAWRDNPEFKTRFGACRELCDEFYGGDYRSSMTI